MHKNAIVTGVLLFLLGPIFYFLQRDGSPSATAFIPSLIGILIGAFGLAAANPARTKTAMHVAAALGLVGLLGSLMSARKWPALLTGQEVERPLAA